jgi:hypothetical protein
MKPFWADTYWTEETRNGIVRRVYFFFRTFDAENKTGVAVFQGGFKLPLR